MLPMFAGNALPRMFEFKSRARREDRLERAGEMEPERIFSPSNNEIILGHCQKLVGNAPFQLICSKVNPP
uniref:Uncharacterized protein n=1 Tax=Setaria italica TaxID=4555 RepID=K3YXE9_SETIT